MGPLRLFVGDREGRLEHKECTDGTPVTCPVMHSVQCSGPVYCMLVRPCLQMPHAMTYVRLYSHCV